MRTEIPTIMRIDPAGRGVLIREIYSEKSLKIYRSAYVIVTESDASRDYGNVSIV